MVISDNTKRIVSLLKSQLGSQRDQVERELVALEVRKTALTEQRDALGVDYESLETDIAEPTPVVEEPV